MVKSQPLFMTLHDQLVIHKDINRKIANSNFRINNILVRA